MNKSKKIENFKGIEASKGNKEFLRHYNNWSGNYEKDSLEFGYHRALAVMCGLFRRYVEPASSKILDVGAGTGMLGELLALLGYTELTALDMSQGMLKIASEKNIYKGIRQMTIDSKMDIPVDSYDAIVAMGVFTAGCSMPADSFRELVRITRPGGTIIFSIRTEISSYQEFNNLHQELEKEDKWRLIDVTQPFQSLKEANPEAVMVIKVYEVL